MRFMPLCAAGASLVMFWGLARADEEVRLLPPISAGRLDSQNSQEPADSSSEADKPQEGTVSVTVTTQEPDKDTPAPPPSPWIPEIIGDQAPIGTMLRLPSGQIRGTGAIYVPSARYFKISDDDSPEPRSRTYFSFNYFYDLGDTINRRIGSDIERTRIHREIFGFEWADTDGCFSFGMRLPIDTYNAAGIVRGLDGASTDIGDLSIILKWLLWKDSATGNLVSMGFAITPPTGPSPFAGSRDLAVFHNTCLQPYCGWIWSLDKFYLQGFTAVDAPTDLNDVVMLYNSVAAGYFLYQAKFDNEWVAVIPTVEVHVNTPLNHRGINLTDPAGTADMVDITSGVQFEYRDNTSMALAFAVPVTGPRLFNFEILAQLRWRH